MRWSLIVFVSLFMVSMTAGVGICQEVVSQPAQDIAGLINQLGDKRTREAAVSELEKAGAPAIAALSNVLDRKDDSRMKHIAIHALYDIAAPESVPAIKKGLRDTNPEVRLEALVYIADLAWKKHVVNRIEAWETIRASILDEDSDVRCAAASYLFRLNQAKSVPLLIDALDRELKTPREKRGRHTLRKLFATDPEDENICMYASCLGTVADNSCLAPIEAYIGKGNKEMDYTLAEILIRCDRTHVHKDLLIEGATKCSTPITKIMIISELWQVDDPRVEGILKEALSDPYTSTNPMIVKYPIRVNAKQSLEKLEMKKQGRDPLAEEAAKLLKSIQDQQKHSAEQHTMPPLPAE